jgi:hypothetical protein
MLDFFDARRQELYARCRHGSIQIGWKIAGKQLGCKKGLAAESIYNLLPFLITPGSKTNLDVALLPATFLYLGDNTPVQNFKSFDPACAAVAAR